MSPPLRKRREDIPLLVWTFIKEFESTFNRVIERVAKQSWTHLIGQPLDDDKCFLHHERDALERSNETEKTKPFPRV